MTQSPSGQTHLPVANPEGSIGQDVDIWALLGTLPVPMVVHELGEGTAARFVNPSFTTAFGYTLADVPSVEAWAERAYPDPDYRRKAMARWWDQIASRQATGTVEPPR